MITPTPQTSLANARRYFREHLRVGDYYAEAAVVTGTWFGRAAQTLGLEGAVLEGQFLALCDAKHPVTAAPLSARHNTIRREQGINRPNRRIFYDFTFRPPKSVSLVAYLVDERVFALHRDAVRKALGALETYAATRVRRDGACTDRTTGNMVAALFEHDTSREQDPLLHTHAVVFNTTWDAAEDRWKALQTHEMYKALAYADAIYSTELTRELARLGYGIRRLGRTWEIAGVPRPLIERFSKRRTHIAQRLAEELAKPENRGMDPHRLRDRIARDERRRKIRGADRRQLIARWRRELGADGSSALAALRGNPLPPADYRAALAWGKEYVFERKSVVRLHELLAAAARRVFGTDATMEQLRAEAFRAGIVREEDGDRVASVDGLRREWGLVERARQERGRHRPLVERVELSRSGLDEEQAAAVVTLLQSRDGVTLFRGVAGTGKSYTLKRVLGTLQAAGHTVCVAAPQAQQARGLTADGIPTITISQLLQRDEIPVSAVLLIEEAGQIGGRQMEALFGLARRRAARIILSGDTRQHPSVEASDAMRALEAYAGVTTAEIQRIRRQDPALGTTEAERRVIATYRRAVSEASEGHAAMALALLNGVGCVQAVDRVEVIPRAAAEYERLMLDGLRTLAISQTREAVEALNAAISERLEARGIVREVRRVTAFLPRDLVRAEKQLPETYEAGILVRFVRAYGAFSRGAMAAVIESDRGALVLDCGDGVRHRVALKHADRWEVVDEHEIPVGVGSLLQLKANGVTAEGSRIVNGEIVTVTGFHSDGRICVRDGGGATKWLGRRQSIMQLGYALTSYGSQGRTVDAVVVADAGVSAASHGKEWYVSISRARRRIAVFTPSVRDLARRISESGDRMLAIELTPPPQHWRVGLQSLISGSLRRARHGLRRVRSTLHV